MQAFLSVLPAVSRDRAAPRPAGGTGCWGTGNTGSTVPWVSCVVLSRSQDGVLSPTAAGQGETAKGSSRLPCPWLLGAGSVAVMDPLSSSGEGWAPSTPV